MKPSGLASYRVSGASYILMLDEQSSQAQNVLHTFVCLTRQRRARHKVLHKSLTMKHCFRLHFITPRQAAKAPQYEASPVFISLRRGKPFHSDMKHFAYAPYDLSSIALRATDDGKMKNESCVCKYSLSMLYYSVEKKNLMEKTANCTERSQ